MTQEFTNRIVKLSGVNNEEIANQMTENLAQQMGQTLSGKLQNFMSASQNPGKSVESLRKFLGKVAENARKDTKFLGNVAIRYI